MKRAGLVLLVLAGCSHPLPASGPLFNPLDFFTGHVTSWGVEENRAGAPIAIVTTDCFGHATGPHSIDMAQTLRIGNARPQTRLWRFTEVSTTNFTATANDMSGTANGTVSGREFHWRWTLETSPGDPLANVTMEQWMYHLDNGTVMIRTVVTKLDVRLLEVSEIFEKK